MQADSFSVCAFFLLSLRISSSSAYSTALLCSMHLLTSFFHRKCLLFCLSKFYSSPRLQLNSPYLERSFPWLVQPKALDQSSYVWPVPHGLKDVLYSGVNEWQSFLPRRRSSLFWELSVDDSFVSHKAIPSVLSPPPFLNRHSTFPALFFFISLSPRTLYNIIFLSN